MAKTDIAGINRKINAEIAKRQLEVRQRVLIAVKAATPVKTGHARDSWVIENGSITNSADYISDLNNGHSAQAPSHFIEKAVLSVSGVVPNGIIVEQAR